MTSLLIQPFCSRRTLYFETNVWDALQRAGGVQSDQFATLREVVAGSSLRIVAGVMVFEETLALYEHDSPRAIERLALIEALADLPRTVSHSPEVLRGHVAAAICGTAPPTPVTDTYANLSELRGALAQHRGEIPGLLAPNRQKDLESVEVMRAHRGETQAELKRLRLPRLTLANFQNLPISRFDSFVQRYYGEGPPMPSEILNRLAGSRPVRMYHEGITSLFYNQMVLNRAPRKSDLRDIHHAVSASVTDGLVSQDRALREWCGRVSLPGFGVCSLAELLVSLGV